MTKWLWIVTISGAQLLVEHALNPAGQVQMSYVAAIAAAVGAIMGYYQQSLQNRQASAYQADYQQLLKKATGSLSSRAISRRAGKLRPQIREAIQSAAGPAYRQTVEANLARTGLSGTGVGQVLADSALLAPEIEAVRQSFDTALALAQQKAQILSGGAAGLPPAPQGSPLAAALSGGLQAGLTARSLYKKPATTATPGNVTGGWSNPYLADIFRNLYGTPPFNPSAGLPGPYIPRNP